MTRDEHLQWCKDRALQYVDAGDLRCAFTSMISDLGKHEETLGVTRIMGPIGMAELIAGRLNTPALMRKFINGFN